MRILHVIADGNPGGGTTFVLNLLESLRRQGGRDLALISQPHSYALERDEASGIASYGVDFFKGRLNRHTRRDLGALIDQVKPALIHVHGARAGLALTLSARPGHIPVVYTVHGYHFLHKSLGVRQLAALSERHISRRADATIFVCEHDRTLARERKLLSPYKETRVIYNGIIREQIPVVEACKTKLVGFLGRLTQPKNPLFVLEVARLLAPEGYTFKLIGGGELEPKVRELIQAYRLQQSVEVLGSLPHGEALEALRDVGALILPSLWEGLPLAVLEAMQMGIPVIAAKVSSLPEIIQDDVSGVLIREYDPKRYAKAIRRFADDPQKRQRVIAAGRKIVAGKFTFERVVAQHLELYEELVGKSPKRATPPRS